MELSRKSKLMAIVIGFIFAGCATFQPGLRYQDLMRARQPTAKEVREGLEVSIEEFVSREKSRRAFDADIAPHGVLAFFLRIENKSPTSYIVRDTDSRVFLHDRPLNFLQGIDAARQAASSDGAAKAAAWTVAMGPFALLFWAPAISISGSHTQYVNQRIEHHFDNLQFGNVLLRPAQAVGGFLYFKIPNGTKRLEDLTVEVVASEEKTPRQVSIRFPVPILELSAPVLFLTDRNVGGEGDRDGE
jgi:hypothetical protein